MNGQNALFKVVDVQTYGSLNNLRETSNHLAANDAIGAIAEAALPLIVQKKRFLILCSRMIANCMFGWNFDS